MESYDEEFEKYLKEFRPRHPRALPQRARLPRVWRLAAVAVIAVSIGSSLWLIIQKNVSRETGLATRKAPTPVVERAPRPLSMHALSKMALDSPQELEARLAQASRQTLPDFRSSDSTLRLLAKE